ncbi:MAG: DEAD/DEAH box helicase [Planctomycetaceae bacterium]
MSNFSQLHALVQHHVVNSLGWRSLRPFQDDVIPHLLSGRHMVILAPTAGGKTEAAFFPLVTRLLSDSWPRLSILYVCPLKALLNNLHIRLSYYCRLLGLNCGLWHGDVRQSERKRILRDPPEVLLTTPESLEVMLLSSRVDHRAMFADLRVVIVDEVHSFAGDDRGWHLLSVLSRVTRFAGRELQRVGLSATVGNPEELLSWLTFGSSGESLVYSPPDAAIPQGDVSIDYVGQMKNAATVISRLHRGEKRLAFVDSRSRVEELGTALRSCGTRTWVTHSSLSQEQRLQAEQAFAGGQDCVIVATSVLELGIDVGDLDRVIQIDSPPSVAGFLQRMGRTGRRTGSTRNCLLLATDHLSLLLATAVVDVWQTGYVEPVTPPPAPLHILAHQLMALAVQQRGVKRQTILHWLDRVPAFAAVCSSQLNQLIDWMISEDLIWDDNGVLWFGKRGEKVYGRQNFMELFSVFMVPPVFEVMHGRHHIGSVDEITFLTRQQGVPVLLLGGKPWQVNHVEWSRRIAYVEPVPDGGIARWCGSARPISHRLATAVRRILTSVEERAFWSQRAVTQMQQLRLSSHWLPSDQTCLVRSSGHDLRWYTFAGTRANLAIAAGLRRLLQAPVRSNAISLTIDRCTDLQAVQLAIEKLRSLSPESLLPEIEPAAISGLKFSDCLSPDLAGAMLQQRYSDHDAVRVCLTESVAVNTLPGADELAKLLRL